MLLRAVCVLCALALCVSASAAPAFPADTEGERKLSDYVTEVNRLLLAAGGRPVNSLFVCTASLAVLGVTDQDDAEVPENVELTVTLYDQSMNVLTLRASDPDEFARVAAACISAAAPASMDYRQALKAASVYANRVKNDRWHSFRDTVNEQNGESVRTYYAYYINQYGDGVDWLEMTLVFPMAGSDGDSLLVTPPPDATPTLAPDVEDEGIRTEDEFTHFEIFTTPTPEPDSPAAGG